MSQQNLKNKETNNDFQLDFADYFISYCPIWVRQTIALLCEGQLWKKNDPAQTFY